MKILPILFAVSREPRFIFELQGEAQREGSEAKGDAQRYENFGFAVTHGFLLC